MSEGLKARLRPGDQIIALSVAYFDYDEAVKAKRLYSQQPGDLLMVNHTNSRGSVSGTSLTGVAYNGRACLGLGGSLRDGTYRLATPEDPGYRATREEWLAVADRQARRLRAQSFLSGAAALLMLGLLLIQSTGA